MSALGGGSYAAQRAEQAQRVSYGEQAIPSAATVLHELADAQEGVHALVCRIRELSDKLAGPRDHPDSDKAASRPTNIGLLPILGESARTMNEWVRDAHLSIDRVMSMLP